MPRGLGVRGLELIMDQGGWEHVVETTAYSDPGFPPPCSAPRTFLVRLQKELSLMFCNDLDGWNGSGRGGGGREAPGGRYAYIWLTHDLVQQKLTQRFKAIIL